ncbi:MAG: Ig-like domain-containing protein [Candidatus Ozemobacteraceae bacterium]
MVQVSAANQPPVSSAPPVQHTSIADANVTTQGAGAITGAKLTRRVWSVCLTAPTIDNANVTLSAALSTTGAGSFVGGIAGDAAGANITRSNVTFSATVSAAATAAGSNVGGIAGNAADSNITRSNVTFAATLSASAAGSNVGGIAGNAASANISDSNVTFDETVSTVAADSKVGGIAGNVSGASSLTSNKVTAANLISAAAATSYAGGIVGYAADTTVAVTNNSFISAVAAPDHAVSALSGTAAGCVAGNETGHTDSLYNKNSITSTTVADAVEFVISGNTCTCPQHTHPINTKSNDFMAGKNHTLPLLSSILPIHSADVTHSVVGAVSVYPQITMTFDKPMNRTSVETAFKLYRHDDAGVVTATTYADGFVFTWDTDNQRVQATPKTALEFSRAYTAELTKATAKDIHTNSVADIKLIASTGTNDANIIRWSFKTTRGDKPSISGITFNRDRRTLGAQFSANVADGADISDVVANVGVYYSLDIDDANPVNTTGWGDKLHTPTNLILTGTAGHNHVQGTLDHATGLMTCTLTEANLTDVNTPYYLVPYVITTDGFIHFGAQHKVVVHPWNLRDGNNTATELAKVSSELTANAFVIETAADLTNLSLSDINATALKGDGTLYSTLEDLKGYYWTQACNFIQVADVSAVIFANPIGDTTAFTGTYNGQNYTVASLAVTGNANYAGMFGLFTGASVKNLNVSALTLTGATTGSVGLIASVNAVATIDNINLNDVDVSAITGAANSAGLIGLTGAGAVTVNNVSVTFKADAGISGTSAAGLIGTAGAATSIADAKVTTQGTGAITGDTYASGLVGLFNGTAIDNADVTLSAALSTTGENSFVGGIAGNAAGAAITNSNVTFAETVSAADAGSKVGGIAGNVSGASSLTSNKVTAAKLISAAAAASYAGGIVGYAADTTVAVTNNSFISAVAAPDHAVSALSGTAAGCVAGNETGHADSLYNKNSITSTTVADAVEFVISGNTCTCDQHTHPINTKSNDFMAGKNHTLPLLSSILPIHSDDVTHSVVGAVSVYPQITMTFDKPMNRTSVEAAFKLYRHDDAGVVTATTYADGFVFTWDTDNQRVQATPKTALEFSRAYTAELTKATAKDIHTNSVAGIKAYCFNRH